MPEESEKAEVGSPPRSRQGPKEELVIQDNVPVYYSNNAQVRVSFYDFVLDFRFTEEATPKRLLARELARVAMSPQHAKVLAIVLRRNVAEFEKRFGTITVPEGVLPPGADPQ